MKIKRDIRDKRNQYRESSSRLRYLSAPGGKESQKQIDTMRIAQDKIYKKWRFYDGIIKASEKANKENQEQN